MTQRFETSLPSTITPEIRSGSHLVGDDFTPREIARWFAQEKEAFFSNDEGNSLVDPFYAYMRTLTRRLGSVAFDRPASARRAMLVLGPGEGLEVEEFARTTAWTITFVEASDNLRLELAARFPAATVMSAEESGKIQIPECTVDLVLALSVLHHIPNVSFVLSELSRVLKPGGYAIIREPCSSMGDWRRPRSATPNERGICRGWMLSRARAVGLSAAREPVPVMFHPLSIVIKRLGGRRLLETPAYFWFDMLISRLVQRNDHYWRDSWSKKLGPSAYFYVFRKSDGPETA